MGFVLGLLKSLSKNLIQSLDACFCGGSLILQPVYMIEFFLLKKYNFHIVVQRIVLIYLFKHKLLVRHKASNDAPIILMHKFPELRIGPNVFS